jgi:hypothetical protein
MQIAETSRQVKNVQSVMLLVVTVQVLGMVYLLVTGELDTAMASVMVPFTAVYVGLWAWCKRNPLAASIVGLVVFVVVHLIEALIDPATFVRGWVIILGITAALGWAVRSSLQHRKLRA